MRSMGKKLLFTAKSPISLLRASSTILMADLSVAVNSNEKIKKLLTQDEFRGTITFAVENRDGDLKK